MPAIARTSACALAAAHACSATAGGQRQTDLYQELVSPVVQVVEGLLRVHIIHKHAAVGAAVEGYAQALEPLLPSCVPDLRTGFRVLRLGEGFQALAALLNTCVPGLHTSFRVLQLERASRLRKRSLLAGSVLRQIAGLISCMQW